MVRYVHPIERLRYVARCSGAPQELMVRETAAALVAFADDPSGLVTACRRIVSRQLTSGPMWWLCSRLLTAADPLAEARAVVDEIDSDPTSRRLADELGQDATVLVLDASPQIARALARRGDLGVLVVDVFADGDTATNQLRAVGMDAEDVPLSGLAAAVLTADIVLIEATVLGPTGLIGVAGSHAASSVANQAGIPVWAVGGRGRVVPPAAWEAIISRFDTLGVPWERAEERVPLDLFGRIVGPDGPAPAIEAVEVTDCPVAPELFKADIT